MKFSEAWLRELVNPDLSTKELADQLTMAGLEVDGFEPVAAEFDGVVVGEILEVNVHPDADRLAVCRVSSGSAEQQVVCGAPNARSGIKVPFAQVGAALPDMKIRKAKIRGMESQGMLCSEKELGLGDNHEGLMELPLEAPVGDNLRGYLGLNDSVIDLDMTPNRGDCLSIIGLAREVGLLNNLDVAEVAKRAIKPVIEDVFPVELAAADACPRFVGRVVRNIDQGAVTPLWMQEKLRRSGIRSISPVVDVTNYVMLELGQPLHAYDLDKLKGRIIVRQSKAGEKLRLLNGNEVETLESTLLITDDSGPIGLAGVMGGLGTAVTLDTKHLFLESAFFTPGAVAGRARSYGMSTDAAYRFERGVDWRLQSRALERATELLVEIAGGQPGPVSEETDASHLPGHKTIELRASRLEQLLGVAIEDGKVDEILARLAFPSRKSADRKMARIFSALTGRQKGKQKEGPKWKVSAPSHRFDIAGEADLIEEISRVHGYNNLPSRVPRASLQMVPESEAEIPLRRFRDQLVSRGYHEAITYSFVDSDLQRSLDPTREPIELANPLSAEMSVMRTTLWTGLLKALIYNVNRQQHRVRLFETGLCFLRSSERQPLNLEDIIQVRKLAGIACGPRQVENWSNDSEAIDFYDIKGDLEAVLQMTGQSDTFEVFSSDYPGLHPGKSAAIGKNGEIIGYMGLLDPVLQQKYEIRYPVYLFELEIDQISGRKLIESVAFSRFPEVRWDIAVIVGQEVTAAALRQCIESAAGDTLQDLKLFDVYQGEGIEAGQKSIALGLTFQHASRTLADDDVKNAVDGVVAALAETFGARLRGEGSASQA